MTPTVVQYEPCISCGASSLVSPTTTFPEGIICADCLLTDAPCRPAKPMPVGYAMPALWRHTPEGMGSHNPSCPQSSEFDRRKTRTNLVECPSTTLDGEA